MRRRAALAVPAVRLSLLVVRVAAITAVFAPGVASAYCRTTSVRIDDPSYSPQGACWDKGVPLWWRNSCVGYSIQRDGSRQVAYDDAANAIARSFSRWTGASCPSGDAGLSRASIDVRDLGPVNCSNVGQNSRVANQNVIIFRDAVWPHDDKDNTLALTTVSYDKTTGELLGADIEVNTAEKRVSIADPVPPDGYDFESIMTHEIGHFLGLAHSGDAQATMFARYDPGTTVIRNLGADDVSGICEAYPSNGTRTVGGTVDPSGSVRAEACNPTPQNGFTTECDGAVAQKSCSISAAGAPFPGGVAAAVGSAAALGLLGIAVGRRRPRHREGHRRP